jgi:hypothetical protein
VHVAGVHYEQEHCHAQLYSLAFDGCFLCLYVQVADLGPDELVSEFRALQELALASYSSKGDIATDDARTGDQKAKNKINTEMEEYLLQQVMSCYELLWRKPTRHVAVSRLLTRVAT